MIPLILIQLSSGAASETVTPATADLAIDRGRRALRVESNRRRLNITRQGRRLNVRRG